MDELTKWRLEEMARQIQLTSEWLRTSGAVDMMRFVSEQLEVLNKSELLAEVARTAAVLRDFEDNVAGEILRFQATYAEAIALLVGLHQQYAGIGTTFTLTSGEDDSSEEEIQERRLILPADNQIALGGEVTMSGDLQIEVIRGSASIVQEGDTLSATGRVIEASASLVGTSTLNARATVLNTHASWAIERSENSSRQHQFILRTGGDDEEVRKLDFIADFAQCVMRDDESGKRHVLSSFLSSTSDRSAVDAPASKLLLPNREQETQGVAPAAIPDEEISTGPAPNDDVMVLWKKQFSNEDIFQARHKIRFDVAVQTVESALTHIERETNGELQVRSAKGVTQVRFTVLTTDGRKGLDVTVGNALPGIPGWGYYAFPTGEEGRLWRAVGTEILKWIGRELDNQAAYVLIADKGADAFEDVPVEVKIDGQVIDVLRIVNGRPTRLVRAVDSLLDYYDEVQATFQIIDDMDLARQAARTLLTASRSLSMEEAGLGDAGRSGNSKTDEIAPWENIRDHSWDRMAVQLLWQGHSDPEIAKKLCVSAKRVTNRLSELRRQFPAEVPTRAELREVRRKSGQLGYFPG